MPRRYSKKSVDFIYEKFKLNALPGPTVFPLQVSLRLRRGGGYLSALHRQQRKNVPQLKGMPGCGPRTKDLPET